MTLSISPHCDLWPWFHRWTHKQRSSGTAGGWLVISFRSSGLVVHSRVCSLRHQLLEPVALPAGYHLSFSLSQSLLTLRTTPFNSTKVGLCGCTGRRERLTNVDKGNCSCYGISVGSSQRSVLFSGKCSILLTQKISYGRRQGMYVTPLWL